MQYSKIIPLSHSCVQAILSGEVWKLDLLTKDIELQKGKLDDLISEYHNGANVSCYVKSIEMLTDGNGTLYVDYTVHRYSGCKDVDLSSDDNMPIGLEVNFIREEFCSQVNLFMREARTFIDN